MASICSMRFVFCFVVNSFCFLLDLESVQQPAFRQESVILFFCEANGLESLALKKFCKPWCENSMLKRFLWTDGLQGHDFLEDYDSPTLKSQIQDPYKKFELLKTLRPRKTSLQCECNLPRIVQIVQMAHLLVDTQQALRRSQSPSLPLPHRLTTSKVLDRMTLTRRKWRGEECEEDSLLLLEWLVCALLLGLPTGW